MIADVERLLRALAAIEGVTSAAGTVNTFVDAVRVEGIDYWNGRAIVALSGAAKGQITVIVDDNGAGTLTVRPALSAAPGANQVYLILKQVGDIVAVVNTDENYTPGQNIGNKTDAAALDDMTDITNRSIQARLRLVLSRMSSNAFLAHIQGADRTELDTMLAQLALYFDVGGDALSVTMNPGAGARASLQLILQDLADMLAGGTGIVTFPGPAAAANGVSAAEVIRYIQETVLGYEGGTSLAAKLTLLRAGYLDELGPLNIPADVDTIKAQTNKLAGAALVTGASAAINWNTGVGTSLEAGADLITIGGAGVKQKLVKLLINIANITTASVVEIRAYDQAHGVVGKRLAYSQVRQTPAQGTAPDIVDIIAQTGGPIELDNAMRLELYSSANEAKVIDYEYRLELR